MRSTYSYELCEQQEDELKWGYFTHAHALMLGMGLLDQRAKKHTDPIAIEITLNGLVVYRYFQDGALPDSALWLQRKRNSVELMHMSSLRFGFWLEKNDETLESRKLPVNDYAVGGGGFPIRIEGTGVVGSICVSGCADSIDDHQLIIDAMRDVMRDIEEVEKTVEEGEEGEDFYDEEDDSATPF